MRKRNKKNKPDGAVGPRRRRSLKDGAVYMQHFDDDCASPCHGNAVQSEEVDVLKCAAAPTQRPAIGPLLTPPSVAMGSPYVQSAAVGSHSAVVGSFRQIFDGDVGKLSGDGVCPTAPHGLPLTRPAPEVSDDQQTAVSSSLLAPPSGSVSPRPNRGGALSPRPGRDGAGSPRPNRDRTFWPALDANTLSPQPAGEALQHAPAKSTE